MSTRLRTHTRAQTRARGETEALPHGAGASEFAELGLGYVLGFRPRCPARAFHTRASSAP